MDYYRRTGYFRLNRGQGSWVYQKRYNPRTRKTFIKKITRVPRLKFYPGRGNNQIARPELKWKDILTTAASSGPLGTITLLNGIANGTGPDERIGRRIQVKSVALKGVWQYASLPAASAIMMTALVWDNCPNESFAQFSEIFNEVKPEANINLDNRDRFRIIWRKIWCMGYATQTATQALAINPGEQKVDIFKKLNGFTTYDDSSAAMSAINTGALYMVHISSSTLELTWNYSTRIRYFDS